MEDMDAIAVTYGPGLNGALLVGIEAAKALAFAYDKPLIKVNHMAGHIYANKFAGEFKFPLLSFFSSKIKNKELREALLNVNDPMEAYKLLTAE